MGTLYRAMRSGLDGRPVVGRSARELGVRIHGRVLDVELDGAGRVTPGRGRSVSLDDPYGLPDCRLPTSWGGTGRDTLFEIHTVHVVDPLEVFPSGPPHHEVGVARPTLFETYEGALADTRPHWNRT